MSFCKCGDGQQNLGVLSCPRLLGTVKKHITVNAFDSEGNRNSILYSELSDGKLTDAYINGKLNEADPSKRWYITPTKYENVEPSRTDSTFEDFSSGARVKVDTGVKEFKGILPQVDGVIADKMNAGACSLEGKFEIDVNGSLKGEMSLDGLELFPILIAKGSFEAIEIDPVEGSATQRIEVSFQYDKSVKEGNLRIIPSDSIEVNLLQINGIIDGVLTETGVATATEISFSFLIKDFGYFGEIIPIEGKVSTSPEDWTVTDTGLNNIVPTTIVEADGIYTLTIPSTPSETLSVVFAGVPLSAVDQQFESNTIEIVTPV